MFGHITNKRKHLSLRPSNELYSKQTQFSRYKHNDGNQIRDFHTHFIKQVLCLPGVSNTSCSQPAPLGLKIEHNPLKTPKNLVFKTRRPASKPVNYRESKTQIHTLAKRLISFKKEREKNLDAPFLFSPWKENWKTFHYH